MTAASRIRFQIAAALDRRVVILRRHTMMLPELCSAWTAGGAAVPRVYETNVFVIASAMLLASACITSSDSASTMTRASASVPE
jgi:hypothetical protein